MFWQRECGDEVSIVGEHWGRSQKASGITAVSTLWYPEQYSAS